MANYAETRMTERDLTQVASSASGVPVGLVGGFRRGTINTPRLNANDTQFLKNYTRNGKSIDIKDPEACFHSVTSLEQTQELWTGRCAKNALYAAIKILTENYTVTSSNNIIRAFTVDVNLDQVILADNVPVDTNTSYLISTDGVLPAPLTATSYYFKTLPSGNLKVFSSLSDLNTPAKTVALDGTLNTVTSTAHGLAQDSPVYLVGTLSTGLTQYQTYFVNVVDVNTFELFDAPSGLSGLIVDFTGNSTASLFYNFINLTTAGTGNHALNETLNLDTDKVDFNGTQVVLNSNKMNIDTAFIARLYTGSKISFFGASLPNPLVQGTTYFSVVDNLDPTYIRVAKTLAEANSKTCRFSVNPSTNVLTTEINTGMVKGQSIRMSSDGVLPSVDVSSVISPLDSATTYFLVKISDKTFKVASSYANATASTPVTLDLVGVGIGNHTISPRFVEFSSVGSGTNYIITRNNSSCITDSNFFVTLINNRIIISSLLGDRLENNSIVTLQSIGGDLPAPLTADTDYYVIKLSDTEIQLTSVPDGSPIDITTIGDGILKITNNPKILDPTAVNLGNDDAILLFAKNQGKWGDEHYARIIDNRSQVADSFIIKIYHQSNLNVELDNFVVSRKVGAKDNDGNNIFIEDVLDASENIGALSNPLILDTVFPLCNDKFIKLNGGLDGDTITDGDMILSLQATFGNPELVPIKVFIDAGYNVASYQRALNALVADRGTAVALHGTPIAKEKSNDYMNQLVDYRKVELALDSSYSALYTPHVKIKDKYNNRNIYISPEVYGANAICYSKRNFEIFYPPAGLTRGKINVEGLLKYFLKGEMQVLAQSQINVIKFDYANSTNVIWDQQTLSSMTSLLQSLHIRILVNEIKLMAKPVLDRFIFELNDSGSRRLAKSKIDHIGDEFVTKRGLFGYRTVLDDSNNTNLVVSQKKMKCGFFIQPTPEIREIEFDITLLNPGFDIQLAQSL